MEYPYLSAERVVDVKHGRSIPDAYRMLENPTDSRTANWVVEQTRLFECFRAQELDIDSVRSRLESLVDATVLPQPVWRGDRQFFLRRGRGDEHPRLCVLESSGEERVLLDPMVIDPSGQTTMDTWQLSSEGDLLAYQLSCGGTEKSVLHLLDIHTGEPVGVSIGGTRYSPLAWFPGGRSFYYVRRNKDGGQRIYLHYVGCSTDDDVEILGEGLDPATRFMISVSRDGRWFVVSATEGTASCNTLLLADLRVAQPESPDFVVVQEDVDAVSSLFIGGNGCGYSVTNREADRYRLCVLDLGRPDFRNWRELISEDPAAILRGVVLLEGSELPEPLLIASWHRFGASELTVHSADTGDWVADLPLPGVGTVGGLGVKPEGGHEVWFTYTDPATPACVMHYDALREELSPWWPVAGSTAEVTTQVATCHSEDGTEVRLLITSGKAYSDEPRPALVRVYGGFGVPPAAHYSPEAVLWSEAGGIFVEVHPRGCGGNGEAWHRAGTGAGKQNTIDDFVAAAEWLIDQGWTSGDRLAATGSSNGGLVVAAAATQRPELYSAAVCVAPLTDMARYEFSGMGRSWVREYGSVEDPEALDWLLAYSPYHRVVDGTRYPAMLLAEFQNDTRVDPAHARKLCAALQAATGSVAPVLLRSGVGGHGARSLSNSLDLIADTLSFAAWGAGLTLGIE